MKMIIKRMIFKITNPRRKRSKFVVKLKRAFFKWYMGSLLNELYANNGDDSYARKHYEIVETIHNTDEKHQWDNLGIIISSKLWSK